MPTVIGLPLLQHFAYMRVQGIAFPLFRPVWLPQVCGGSEELVLLLIDRPCLNLQADKALKFKKLDLRGNRHARFRVKRLPQLGASSLTCTRLFAWGRPAGSIIGPGRHPIKTSQVSIDHLLST